MPISQQTRNDLIAAARSAAARAYCPYSRFAVGAAVLTGRGEIFSGCNVENASYGLTICAERNAVFQAVAQSPGPVAVRAILVYTATDEPTAPCGACRQVINEFGPEADVLAVCDGPAVIEKRLSELLPQAFGPRNLYPDAVSTTRRPRG
jgi:cytidine deaminase